jgi:hypothetical protein
MSFYIEEPDPPLANFQDLLERARNLLGSYSIDSVYLRGQGDYTWGLLPTISRLPDYGGKRIVGYDADRERYLLHRFRRYIWEFLKREVTERELLLLGACPSKATGRA